VITMILLLTLSSARSGCKVSGMLRCIFLVNWKGRMQIKAGSGWSKDMVIGVSIYYNQNPMDGNHDDKVGRVLPYEGQAPIGIHPLRCLILRILLCNLGSLSLSTTTITKFDFRCVSSMSVDINCKK
jgi:hypothetical protein